ASAYVKPIEIADRERRAAAGEVGEDGGDVVVGLDLDRLDVGGGEQVAVGLGDAAPVAGGDEDAGGEEPAPSWVGQPAEPVEQPRVLHRAADEEEGVGAEVEVELVLEQRVGVVEALVALAAEDDARPIGAAAVELEHLQLGA